MSSLIAAAELPVSSHTVRDVRELVLDLVAAWDSRVSRVDLVLLVDELSSEITERAPAGSTLRLELGLSGATLRLALLGDHGALPHAATAYDVLVGVLARRSGEEPGPRGVRRWFELDPAPDLGTGRPGDGVPRPSEVVARLLELGAGRARRAGALSG